MGRGPRQICRLIGSPTQLLERSGFARFFQGGAEQLPLELMQLRVRPVARTRRFESRERLRLNTGWRRSQPRANKRLIDVVNSRPVTHKSCGFNAVEEWPPIGRSEERRVGK